MSTGVTTLLASLLVPEQTVDPNRGGNRLTGGDGLDLLFASLADVADQKGIEVLQNL